jgi:hypothetical protein
MSAIKELLRNCLLSGYIKAMAYILTTIVLWVLFFILIPCKDWRKYYPTLLFTALLGTIADLLGVVFDQWAYYGPVVGSLSLWSVLGIAPAEGGLFIRLFPINSNYLIKTGYWTLWSVGNAFFEWFFVWVGWIGYDQWNPLRATIFYLVFFGAVLGQEYWYNGTGKLKKFNGEVDDQI